MSDIREMNKNIDKLSAKLANMQLVDLFNLSRDVKGVNVVAVKLDDVSVDTMRQMGDTIKEKYPKIGSRII